MERDTSPDERHLARMRDAIRDYLAQRIALSRLVSNLDGLLSAMEIVPEEWRDEYLRHWGKLEDVLAESLDRNDPRLIEKNRQLIDESVTRLLGMIETQRLSRQARG